MLHGVPRSLCARAAHEPLLFPYPGGSDGRLDGEREFCTESRLNSAAFFGRRCAPRPPALPNLPLLDILRIRVDPCVCGVLAGCLWRDGTIQHFQLNSIQLKSPPPHTRARRQRRRRRRRRRYVISLNFTSPQRAHLQTSMVLLVVCFVWCVSYVSCAVGQTKKRAPSVAVRSAIGRAAEGARFLRLDRSDTSAFS